MLRSYLLMLSLVVATATSGGCRSCSNCHDYGPPVAKCNCQSCGTCRAGSANGPYVETPFEDDGYYESDDGYEANGQLPAPQPLDMPQSLDGPDMSQPGGVR